MDGFPRGSTLYCPEARMKSGTKLKFIISMLIFGTLGLVVSKIDLPSMVIVFMRTTIGSAALALVMLIKRERFDRAAIKTDRWRLVASGVCLGGSWVALFEAYKYAGVSVGTLLYYSAPIAVFLLSPLLLKEKIRLRQAIGMAAAAVGVIIINGVSRGGEDSSYGMICALVSAALYAGIMLFNKGMKAKVPPVQSTLIQLAVAAVVVGTYVFLAEKSEWSIRFDMNLAWLIVLGIVHTGIACSMYFSSLQTMPAQSAAVLSYIDPVSAIIFSAIVLGEKMTLVQVFGAVLILGGTIFSQINISEKSAARN